MGKQLEDKVTAAHADMDKVGVPKGFLSSRVRLLANRYDAGLRDYKRMLRDRDDEIDKRWWQERITDGLADTAKHLEAERQSWEGLARTKDMALDDAREAREAWESMVHQRDTELDECRDTVEAVMDQLVEVRKDRDSLADTVNGLHKHCSELEEDLTEAAKREGRLLEHNEAQASSCHALRVALDQEQVDRDEWCGVATQHFYDADELRGERDELHGRYVDLMFHTVWQRGKLHDICAHRDRLSTARAHLHQQVTDLEDELREAREEAAAEGMARRDESNTVAELRDYAAALEARIAQLTLANDADHASLDDIEIVFDGPPGPQPGRFVEVEDMQGRSVRAGLWIQRDDGYWALRLGQSGPLDGIEVGDKQAPPPDPVDNPLLELLRDPLHQIDVFEQVKPYIWTEFGWQDVSQPDPGDELLAEIHSTFRRLIGEVCPDCGLAITEWKRWSQVNGNVCEDCEMHDGDAVRVVTNDPRVGHKGEVGTIYKVDHAADGADIPYPVCVGFTADGGFDIRCYAPDELERAQWAR